jgi:hypothetical protein
MRTKRDEFLYGLNVAAHVRTKSKVITSGAADACKKQRHHTRISPFRVACVVRELSERCPDFAPDIQSRLPRPKRWIYGSTAQYSCADAIAGIIDRATQ